MYIRTKYLVKAYACLQPNKHCVGVKTMAKDTQIHASTLGH